MNDCRLEEIRDLRNRVAAQSEALRDFRAELRLQGPRFPSISSASDNLRQAYVALDQAFDDYSDAIIYEEIQEAACQ